MPYMYNGQSLYNYCKMIACKPYIRLGLGRGKVAGAYNYRAIKHIQCIYSLLGNLKYATASMQQCMTWAAFVPEKSS